MPLSCSRISRTGDAADQAAATSVRCHRRHGPCRSSRSCTTQQQLTHVVAAMCRVPSSSHSRFHSLGYLKTLGQVRQPCTPNPKPWTGVVPVAHDSAGPGTDIVVPACGVDPDRGVGFLCRSEQEYASAIQHLLAMPQEQRLEIAARARRCAQSQNSWHRPCAGQHVDRCMPLALTRLVHRVACTFPAPAAAQLPLQLLLDVIACCCLRHVGWPRVM